MRRLVLLGSSVLAVAGLLAGTGIATGQVLGDSSPDHLDRPAPGKRAALSTDALVKASGVLTAKARFTTRVGRSRAGATSSSNAADAPAAVSVLSVPPGTAVLGGLGQHVSPSCSTTDSSRVQVVYAREQSTPSRYTPLLTTLQSYVADVDDTFALSSPRSGRRVRWVTDASCTPVIPQVVVPDGTFTGNTGADALGPMMASLKAQGMARPDRKYLVFADARTDLCGIGNMYVDPRPGSENANNTGSAMYARVDPLCWPTYADYHSTPAHELMHMLGGVQETAPHGTQYGHCTDESDALCYDDGSGAALTQSCTAPSAEALFDCNHDDYFDEGPAPSGYLATSWNTARSSFLDVVAPLAATAPVTPPAPAPAPSTAPPAAPAPTEPTLVPPAPVAPVPSSAVVAPAPVVAPPPVVAPVVPPVAVAAAVSAPTSLYVGATGRVTVTLRSSRGPLATRVILRAWSRTTGWRTVGNVVSSASGVAAFSVRSTSATTLTLRALVPATAAVTASSSANRLVAVVRRPTTTRVGLTVGRPDTLRAALRTNAGTAVAGQYVTLQMRSVGASTWRTVTRKMTSRSGQTSHTVQPRRRTYFRWVYPGATTLAPSTSATATVSY